MLYIIYGVYLLDKIIN